MITSFYEFAEDYCRLTINPVHRGNIIQYLKNTRFKHTNFTENIPLDFSVLEGIREGIGLSKSRIHKEYYALAKNLKSSKRLTRTFLSEVIDKFSPLANCPEFFRTMSIANGSYSYDEIIGVEKVRYKGYVYNLTTKGNYIVNNILTHNTGGLGTPPHERVDAGAIHKAHKGVLFIDEIATLKPEMQVELRQG